MLFEYFLIFDFLNFSSSLYLRILCHGDSVNCLWNPGLGFATFLSFCALIGDGLHILVLFSLLGTSGNFLFLGLSGTFVLGAEILIGTVCSTFGTSLLGFITHMSSLLTAISALGSVTFFNTSSTSCLLRILFPMKLFLAPFAHSVHT